MHQKGHNREFYCPVEASLSIIGNKWTMLIIRDLLKGTKRFGELQRSLDGISPRTLSLRLTELEGEKIIKKKVYPEIPPRTDYTLTPKGHDLAAILEDMIRWSEKHAEELNYKTKCDLEEKVKAKIKN